MLTFAEVHATFIYESGDFCHPGHNFSDVKGMLLLNSDVNDTGL